MAKLFDSHAHLNFPDYEHDYRAVWERAKDAGLAGLINVGTDVATSKRAIEIADELDVFAAVGIHPNDAKQYAGSEDGRGGWKRSIEEMVNDEKVVAIGETGFDLYRQFSTLDEQTALLEYFLDLSEKVAKPLIFHCREAYTELLGIIRGRQGIRGVVHAFGGSPTIARQFLDHGLFISFTAQVTYPKNQDFYSKLLPTIPLDRILLETDCPFLPPEGLRGQRNEPRHVDVIAETIAKFLNQPVATVAAETTKNALHLFRL